MTELHSRKSKILVVGASGQVARSLAALKDDALQICALGRNFCDLSNPASLEESVRLINPVGIINAGGYTHVDKAESEPEQAYLLNRDGPLELARVANRAQIPLIHFSTDSVFDGTMDRPYEEADEARPLNVYGRSKLAGEQAILQAFPEVTILRVSWLFSPWGRNFLWTILNLAKAPRRIQVVADQIGCPTPATDVAFASLAVMKSLLEKGPNGGLYHMTAQGPVSRLEFAHAILEATRSWRAPRSVELEPTATRDFPTPAARGLNAVLNCALLKQTFNLELPHWQNGLLATVEALAIEFKGD
ncbi:dTDP-4-dehydrorhamnose reductase [Aquidulcibacter paucihalophilus]|uniref:dTDP-4-dehydrorhamnose reductase n=1 Tax=Aquidulcibacter paucihalophilus TaxID=1978549 RepID=UPI000A18BD1C|nr:dTDP-4-dehydrorhamnose reductase [Aquidulcibacter paucihalophilus]